MNIDLELVRNDQKFILYDQAAGTETYQIEIRNPSLTVRRFKPSPPFLKSVVRNLDKNKCRYSFRNVDMKATNFAKDLTRISIPNVTSGQIPSRIIFAFVESSGFQGSLIKNPYFFRHFDLKEVNLYVNSEKYPGVPIIYDFDHAITSPGYDFYLEQLGLHQSKTNGITKHDYENGYTAFVFDLTSDLSASQDHFSLIQTGDIFAEFNFEKKLPVEVTCIIYTEYEKLFEIDKDRNINSGEQIF